MARFSAAHQTSASGLPGNWRALDRLKHDARCFVAPELSLCLLGFEPVSTTVVDSRKGKGVQPTFKYPRLPSVLSPRPSSAVVCCRISPAFERLRQNNDEGYFVVKVDALPPPVFWEVELYLRRRLCNQPDRTKKKIPTTFRPTPDSMMRVGGRKRSSSGCDGGGGSDGGSAVTTAGMPGESNSLAANGSSSGKSGSSSNSGGGGGGSSSSNSSKSSSINTSNERGANGSGAVSTRPGGFGASSGVRSEGSFARGASARSVPTSSSTGSRLKPGVGSGRGAGSGASGRLAMTLSGFSGGSGWAEDRADTSFRERGGTSSAIGGPGKRQKVVGNGV